MSYPLEEALARFSIPTRTASSLGMLSTERWPPRRGVHRYSCYGNRPSLPIAEQVFKRPLTLPSYPDLSDTDVERIVQLIREFYNAA